MNALLKIKDEDLKQIERIRKLLSKDTKVEVVREALALLEAKAEREKKIERYRKAARIVANSKVSAEVMRDITEGYKTDDED